MAGGRAKTLDVGQGAYLTNGEELFYVKRAFLPNGQVLLEDCMEPDAPAVVVSVSDLARDEMRVVRPAE